MSRYLSSLGFGPSTKQSMYLRSPEAINAFIHEAYGPRIDAGTEFFTVTPLDARKKVIQTNVVAEGGRSAVQFTVRDLTRHFANIWDKARWFVMTHNHPSGQPAPSQSDLDLTRVIHTVFQQRYPSTKLLDHVITTGSGRYSSLKELNPEIWK